MKSPLRENRTAGSVRGVELLTLILKINYKRSFNMPTRQKELITLFILSICASMIFADLNEGLVANYMFNGNANDESGNGNDGTVINAVLTTDRFGNSDSAYEFGESRYIQVAADSTLEISSAITMSTWIYRNSSTSDWQAIFCKGHTSSLNSPYALLIHYNEITLLLNREQNNASVTVPAEEWIHIAAVWDGNVIKYYLNGVKDDNEDSFTNTLNIVETDMILGADPPGVTEWFNGKLDDMYLYNRSLSDEEILELCNNTITPPQNIIIEINSNIVTVGWDAVSGAIYNVYSSSTPYETFANWTLEISGITATTWDDTIPSAKKFYHVTTVQ